MQNKKKQAVSAPASVAFTGDTTRKRVDTISGSSPFKHVVLKGNKPKQ
jgi:hypothetical protein